MPPPTKGYSVAVTATTTVRLAPTAAPRHLNQRLPGSNLDLLLPPLDVGVFFVYTVAPPDGKAPRALKAALADVLETYYPLAGEMVHSAAGEPEILCNDRGVEFVEATASVELCELKIGEPDESVEGKLVPKKNFGVLCVQVTEFRCGGVVVGCSFDHRAGDAHSFNMFFTAWAEAARSTLPAREPPSFNRSGLAPRVDPPAPTITDIMDAGFALDAYYMPFSCLPPPPTETAATRPVNRIYRVAASDVSSLQAAAGAGRTKMEAFTAHLWRLMAQAAAREQDLCSMGIVVNGRERLCAGNMQNYFGNVLTIPYSTLTVPYLQQSNAPALAGHVHSLIAGAGGEHFRGLIDWVEARRPEPAVARVYFPGERELACVVSSGRSFPVREVDFGWGPPAFGSYHFPWGGGCGYVMPMPSARAGDSDWLVYAHLPPALVTAVEEKPTVFRKIDTTVELGLGGDKGKRA